MENYTQLSGNTFGAILYSDSFRRAPMMASFDNEYIVCPKCKKVYERDELLLKLIDDYKEDEDLEIPAFLLKGMDINVDFEEVDLTKPLEGLVKIKSIIDGDKKKIKRELALVWYLWEVNHNSSENTINKEKVIGNYDKYTQELFDILIKKTEQQSIILAAEIAREKNQFDLAVSILRGIDFKENFREVARKILDKALKRENDIFAV